MKNFKYFVFFPLIILAAACLNAQSLMELSAGQKELSGTSSYQRHSDLEKFNQSQQQNSLPPLTPLSALAEPSNALSVSRLPDIKLNESLITKTVFNYAQHPVLEEIAAILAFGNVQEAREKLVETLLSPPQLEDGIQDGLTAAAAAGNLAVIALQSGEYKIALNYASKASAIDPQNPFYQLLKIWINAARQNTGDAKKEYEKLLFLTADFEYISSAKIALAQAYFLAGKTKEAMPLLANLYGHNPYIISHAAYLMGRIAFNNKDYKTALALLEQAMSHDNNNYMAQKYLAMTEEKLGLNINAWQSYASIFILDTKDKFLEDKLNRLAPFLKASPGDYMFFTRLDEIMQKKPDMQKAAPIRVGLFSKYDGGLASVQGFTILPGADFSIKDEKLGKVITAPAFTPKTIVFDEATQSATIRDKRGNAEFSTKRPFVIDLDTHGLTMLVKDVKAKNVFLVNTGDKELEGSLLVIPGEDGLQLINYTTIEDVLPALIMSLNRGVKEPASSQALAIILRTRLLAEMAQNADKPFDIPDNTPFLRYGGVNMQARYVVDAAAATQDEVLADGKHNLAAPQAYRSCSAVTDTGIKNTGTEINYTYSPSNLFKFMFANPPKDLISAPQDPTLWSAVKWVYVFPVKDIQARLDRKHKIGAFKSARPAKMTRSGRILTMLITGSKGSVELPFAEADFILSAGTLRSNFFYIVPFGREGAPQELMFIGTDTGKGNGLCIDGATGMARAGKTAREILTYYYPDLTVTKEWKLQKPLL